MLIGYLAHRLDRPTQREAAVRTEKRKPAEAFLLSLQHSAGNLAVSRLLATLQRATDLFTGVKPVTSETHARVEAVLTPGATVVPAGPGAAAGAPVVVKGPPPMTGAGKGGQFETDMLASLKTSVGGWAGAFRKLKAKPAAFPIGGASDIAKAAQREVENYFAGYIQVATREPADIYHPGGGYSLVSKLGDESTRPIGDGDRAGWTEYWMTLQGVGQDILDKYHCVPTRAPDDAEFARVLDLFVKNNKADIDDTIHSWPAEAGTGTVFIQPYTDADPKKLRETRWDVFTTLVHEMLHIVAHPNFARTADLIGGTARKYLVEGFDEVMRHDLWDGPGNLKHRIAGDAALRAEVEGKVLPYDASSVIYHNDYDEYAQAKDIATKVGMANAKAAYFLGHTEYLGLGEGTGHEHSLAGVAQWTSKDEDLKLKYVVKAGDTYDSVWKKLNARKLISMAGKELRVGANLWEGMTLQVPGLQRVKVIKGDTVGSVAAQHGITPEALALANDLPKAPATSLAGKTMVYIPVH